MAAFLRPLFCGELAADVSRHVLMLSLADADPQESVCHSHSRVGALVLCSEL